MSKEEIIINMNNQEKIFSNLFYTTEPVVGRVLRSKESYNIGDMIFEESPIFLISKEKFNSEFHNILYERSLAFFHNITTNETAIKIVNIMLAYLEISELQRQNLLNYFFHDSQFPNDYLFQQKFKECVQKLYHELKDLLENNRLFHEERRKYNCSIIDVKELVDIFDIVRLNAKAIEINSVPYSGLFMNFTLMKHDCKANAISKDNNGKVRMYAILPIKANDEITFYYTKDSLLLSPNLIRRQHLFHVKQFWCHCDRCNDEDPTRPLKCPNDGCDSYIYSSMKRFEDNVYTEWQCHGCMNYFSGALLNRSNVSTLEPIIKEEIMLLFEVLENNYKNLFKEKEVICSDINEAYNRAEKFKVALGEKHWLYVSNCIDNLNGVRSRSDYFEAKLLAIEIFAKWANATFTDNNVRHIACTQILNNLKLLISSDVIRNIFESLGKSPIIIEIIHLARGLLPVKVVKVLVEEELDKISEWLLGCCSSCGKIAKTTIKLMTCSRCLSVMYCSKECQKKDWKRHKTYCFPKVDK